MATLAEQRAAIDAGMRTARAATAAAERQAIHDNMVARRTGEAIKDNLNALEPPRRKSGELAQRSAKGGVPAGRSPGTVATQPTGQTAGIASPLEEKDYSTRMYHPTITHFTTDGIFSVREKPIKQITQQDADGAEVLQIFAAPT